MWAMAVAVADGVIATLVLSLLGLWVITQLRRTQQGKAFVSKRDACRLALNWVGDLHWQ
jgi:hypothetical protein